MNWAGLVPIVLGLVLVTLAINGKYRQAWEVISGQGTGQAARQPATRTA